MAKSDLERKLQNELDTLVEKQEDLFSAVLGIVDRTGDLIWAGATGVAYPDTAEAMKVDTPFFLASITKMYTAAVTMILEEQGVLSLDDPLQRFLPASLVKGLHTYKGRDYSDRLRIYHLISQTSGLPDYFEERPSGRNSILENIVNSGDMEWDLEQVLGMVRNDLVPKFPPEPQGQEKIGKKAYYADTNYQLLGAVVESATGSYLSTVLSELILDPLELSSTYLCGSSRSAAYQNRPATIYFKTRPLVLEKAMTSSGPDGGMVSNIADSLTFLRLFLDGRLFLRKSTLHRMTNWKKIFFPFHYGFGLMRFKMPKLLTPFSANPELIGHSGASSSFLFRSDVGGLYFGGTLNQVDNRRRPFRLLFKVNKLLADAT